MKKKTPIGRFLALSNAQKEAEVARFDREIPLSQSRPLNAAEKKVWQKAKEKMGRPTIGQGSKMVPVSIERALLREADAYAKAHKLKRSQLFAQGLRMVMGKAG